MYVNCTMSIYAVRTYAGINYSKLVITSHVRYDNNVTRTATTARD